MSARTLARYEALDEQLPRDYRNALPLKVLELGLLRARDTRDWADTLLDELSNRSESKARR